MDHGLPLITTLAAAFGLALVLGFAAVRLKLPALVGYLVAGVIIGPATPGFVADVELSRQLAEIGVMLLMFGVGLHFSMAELMAVRRVAVPGAIAQIAVATALGMGVATAWGWRPGAGLVFGLALSVASTVVLLRALEDRGLLESTNGRIAVGWLVVEDLVMVLVLVLLPSLAGWLEGAPGDKSPAAGQALLVTLAVALAKVAVFVALMLVVGRRLFPWLLWHVERTGSRELFTLCVIAAAVGIAYGSAELFGVSFALGAFFGGMVLRGSALSRRAADESLPLRDAFSVLFFVSVGMLFDPAMLVQQPWRVITVVAIIVLGKSLAALALVLALRYPLNTALTVSASLAQIGEFSFILAGLGVSLGLLPLEGQNLILAGALIAMALNPLVFGAIEPLQRWIRTRSGRARSLEGPEDPLAALPAGTEPARLEGHVLLVGFGRVGRRVGEALLARGISLVVVEQQRALVETLRQRGVPAVLGDASDAAVLTQAHVAGARALVVATPDTFTARRVTRNAEALRPGLETVVRTYDDDDAALLSRERARRVFIGEEELALGMTRHVLERLGPAGAPPPSPPPR